MAGVRIPYVFRLYFIVISLAKLASTASMVSGQLADVVASYKSLGMGLLFYQAFSYLLLLIVAVTRSLWDVAQYVVLIVILSELSLLGFSLYSEGVKATMGYILFTVTNVVVLLLSIVAVRLYLSMYGSGGQSE
ncbi:MAG: hypothetical protein F7C08_00490 [Desulfurococcales archaeon]|nr:hypothetical protein [Desulfurococcales archaeon]MCE4605003.1 hypothetical protein [Desulfurococcales archaeon]